MSKKMFINDFLTKYGSKTFKEMPFCEVDAVICAALSYADYLASSTMNKKDLWNDKIPLSYFNKHETVKLLSRRYLTGPVDYYNFFKHVLSSKRYDELRITKIENHFNVDKNEQYFSMVFEFDERRIIVFRGTDNTIAGWKEDFLSAIDPIIPAQKYALEYVNKVLKEDKDHDYYIIGHSKGGNLAYYSVLNTSVENLKRIKFCYNFDGNGFKDDKYNYHLYKDKIMKMVPSDDVVGCLFDTFNFKYVIVSDSFSVWAHDMFSWRIDLETGNTFLRSKTGLTRFSKAFQIALNYWVENLSKEDLEDFIVFFFNIVDLGKPNTLKDLIGSLKFNLTAYLKSLVDYPKDKKRKLREMARNYIKDYAKAYLSMELDRYSSVIKSTKNLKR